MRIPSGTGANLALALASTFLTLVLIVSGYEAVANIRYYRWRTRFDNQGWYGRLTVPSRDPVLMWEYRPYGRAGGIRTNRWGFRDRDYPTPDKPAGMHRVAFVGDSVTLGLGVPARDTFVRRVEAMAVATGRRVQALDFSVDGYNALQIRELLAARVLAFAPDQVVYVMCLNDFDFEDSSGQKLLYFRKPRFFLLRDLTALHRRLFGVDFHRYHFRKNQADVFRALVEMRDILAARHIGFLLAIVPVFSEHPRDFADYPLVDIHRAILRFSAKKGIPAHDLLEDFRRQGPSSVGFGSDPWHLTAEGHRLVAESLAPVLFPP